MSEKMKNLLVRTLSGVVLAVAVIGATLWSQWSYGALLLLLLVGCMHEFYRLASRCDQRPQRLLGMATGIVLFAINFMAVCRETAGLMRGGLLTALTAFVLLALSVTLAGVVYVALPVSLMCYIPQLSTPEWNPRVTVAYIAIIWANDVFAYLVGMSVGRHPLFPRLSPKKSWEGFFGGVAGAVVAGLVAARLTGGSEWAWAGLAAVASATGVLGDLAESMFKRAAGVKDSGRIIPGHGGWLDRFDALILSAPFVFVYMLYVM